MSSYLYAVSVIEDPVDTDVWEPSVRLQVVSLEHSDGPPSEDEHDLFLDFIDQAKPTSLISAALQDDEEIDTGRFIENVQDLGSTEVCKPIRKEYELNESDESFGVHDYLVTVTDQRWVQHLGPGDTWGSTG